MLTDDQAKVAISENLKRILEERGHTVYWLMHTLELSSGALYPIVKGKVLPSIAMAARIAEALGVSVDELIQENPKKKSPGKKSA